MSCVFCERVASDELVAANDEAAAFPDDYPVSEGHTLVVPRRHEADFFALSAAEQDAVWALVRDVHEQLARDRSPDGFSVELRVGEAAGQTVMHAHIHVIPRTGSGDQGEPR